MVIYPASYKGDIVVGLLIYNWKILRRLPPNRRAAPNMQKRVRAECRCGQVRDVPDYYFKRRAPKLSCGCLNQSLRTIHKREYGIWNMMRKRCNDPTHVSYKYYGGRGVKVYPEWDDPRDGFEKWFEYMGPAPSETHTLDRYPDNDGITGYRPGNVRWATSAEQRANQRPYTYTSKGR